jgi:NAD(P)H-flavin reductase
MPQSTREHPFHPARLIARDDAGGGLLRMTIGVDREVATSYASPGQYVEVCIENATGFFVLANEPGAHAWELVMRPGGGASDVLFVSPIDALLEVTSAMGVGFPLSEARGKSLVIALGGTGIAAGRPLLARRVSEGDAADTHVFIGVRTRAEFGLRTDVQAWGAAGARVLVCLSHDEGPIDGIPWAGGYVQDVLRARVASVSGSRIFAVGADSMLYALRNLAPQLGITPEHVYTNH